METPTMVQDGRAKAIERGLDAAYRVRSSGYLAGNIEEKVRAGINAALDAVEYARLFARVEALEREVAALKSVNMDLVESENDVG